jgi:hypothetical protein
VLPPGIHSATQGEFEERFVVFNRSDRRLRLYDQLEQVFRDARQTSLVLRVIVAGSFVTAKPEPNDSDCVLVLDPDLTSPSLRPFEYNLVSRRAARRRYGGDVFAAIAASESLRELFTFFQRTRDGLETGIVEVIL